jgi:hypothetical protein
METILGAIAQSTGERLSFCAPGNCSAKFSGWIFFQTSLFSLLSFSGASAGDLQAFVN